MSTFQFVDVETDDGWVNCPTCRTERLVSNLQAGNCPVCKEFIGAQAPDHTKNPVSDSHLLISVDSPSSEDEKEAFRQPYDAPHGTEFANLDREATHRELCRRKLLPFIQKFRPKYRAGWVHEDICRRLEQFVKDVEDGKEPRVLLMMPPRSGKSEIGSRNLPAWILGQHPEWEIIAASHTNSLTMTFSRYVRDLIRDPVYQKMFPATTLDKNSQSVESWNIVGGGGYLAAGVGTGITGRGAHILLLDDLVKDIEAADSDTIRDNTWEWYASTAYTRLAPGGGVLGIMTHWHEDDWAGRIQQVMNTGEGDTFEIIRYPAINDVGDEYLLDDEPGRPMIQVPPGREPPAGAKLTRPHNTAIHPDRYTTEMMLRIKRNLYASGQQRVWHSLYQQNPAPEDGLHFTKDMFRSYGALPAAHGCHIYQAWDFAITENTDSDYTVGATIYQDEFDNLYVADIRRFRSADGTMIIDEIIDYSVEWDATVIGVEDGQIWKALETSFTKRCEERRAYPAYEVLKPLTDKLVRAAPLRGRMQIGKVYFDEKAAWYRELFVEMTRFPAGKHDDQCFIAGTSITLADGSSARIEDIRPGQYVQTPIGPREVLEAGCTNESADVLRVELWNGVVLIGTGNHPVSTERGWISLDSLTLSDIIHVRESQDKGESSWQGFTRKLLRTWTGLSSTGSSIAATLTHLTHTFVATTAGLVAEAFSIATSGSFTMAQYLMVTSSITETRTTLTTTLPTWSASARGDTTHTFTASSSNTVAQKSRLSTWRGFVSRLKRGMQVLKGWRGMQSTVNVVGRIASLSISYAQSVGRLFHQCAPMQSSAASFARIKTGVVHTQSMRCRNVLEQKHAVYNLTVDDTHCYYANDVLVHNCDALAWAVRLALIYSKPRAVNKEPRMTSWRDRLRLYGDDGSAGHMAA